MPFILSFFSSGAAKWISILILVFGLIYGAYTQHRQIVEHEKQLALQEYNLRQLEQNLKDKELFLKQMEDISKHKSEIVANLYIEQDNLEDKLQKALSQVQKHVQQGHDRQSSKILKDAFKALGEMK